MEIVPGLYQLNAGGWQQYLVADDELTLIDTGAAGAGAAVLDQIRSLGFRPDRLTRIVLTHFHVDHAGAAAELRAMTGAQVVCHANDAAVLAGGPVEQPVLMDWERPLYDQITGGGPAQAPAVTPVDQQVSGGEQLDFAGGATVIFAPGHTSGSIGLHLPELRVLFVGDTAANVGGLMLGVFNVDRTRAVTSLKVLAEHPCDVVCFGHGEPLTSDGGRRLRELASGL